MGDFFFQIFVAFSQYLNFKDKRVFFFLGKPLNNTKQKEIASENSKYGDIVQAGENAKQSVLPELGLKLIHLFLYFFHW